MTFKIMVFYNDRVEELAFKSREEMRNVWSNMRANNFYSGSHAPSIFFMMIDPVVSFVKETSIDSLKSTTIEQLGFTVRTTNCLRSEKIQNLYDLLLNSEMNLLRIPNLGKHSLKEIRAKLNDLNLKLKGEFDNEKFGLD